MRELVVLLGTAAIILLVLYRRAALRRAQMTKFALLLLLDERVSEVQKSHLRELVCATPAASAIELGHRIENAIGIIAGELPNTMLGVAGMLWNVRQRARSPDIHDASANRPDSVPPETARKPKAEKSVRGIP